MSKLAEILIVEDDPDIARGLAIRLKAAGFGVTHARDAATAMTTAIKTRPEVVILDIGLPGGDGFMVMERLESNVRTSGTPVIFLSARADPQSMDRAIATGAAGYLVKPYRPEELLALIHSVLGLDAPEDPGS